MITIELLKSWNPCKEDFDKFCELFPNGADLETAINGLINIRRDDLGYWLFLKAKERNLFQELVLKGYMNSGYRNSGDRNSGHMNSGYRNSGDRNSGHRNSGDWNSGDWNSGYRNSGDSNSGHRNSGDWNSGDWNSGDYNSGFFNTQTPEKILVFNKPCRRQEWNGAYKPNFLFFELTYWVDEADMTDEEKAADPHFYVRGGQLRKIDYKEAFQKSWNDAEKEDREKVKNLPNFDAQIFYEISGIDLR